MKASVNTPQAGIKQAQIILMDLKRWFHHTDEINVIVRIKIIQSGKKQKAAPYGSFFMLLY